MDILIKAASYLRIELISREHNVPFEIRLKIDRSWNFTELHWMQTFKLDRVWRMRKSISKKSKKKYLHENPLVHNIFQKKSEFCKDYDGNQSWIRRYRPILEQTEQKLYLLAFEYIRTVVRVKCNRQVVRFEISCFRQNDSLPITEPMNWILQWCIYFVCFSYWMQFIEVNKNPINPHFTDGYTIRTDTHTHTFNQSHKNVCNKIRWNERNFIAPKRDITVFVITDYMLISLGKWNADEKIPCIVNVRWSA